MASETKDRLVSVRKSDLDSLKTTIETLENEEVMRQLRESEKDIEEGRTKEARKLLKELGD